MVPGSTIANLTALWVARDAAGARRVIASESAHLSIRKAAHILGMNFEVVPTDHKQRLDERTLNGDLSDACLVLTAGTTAVGAIDPLKLAGRAAWTHVDAAWAGPLLLSNQHRHRLAGLERADSVVISAHKWLFQPKESGLVLFRDAALATDTLSFCGNYLASPNVGLLGSHGAIAVPLLGTLLAWGRRGIAQLIDHCMENAQRLASDIQGNKDFELFGPVQSGIVVFRARDVDKQQSLLSRLVPRIASGVRIEQETWLRFVAANPLVDVNLILKALHS